MSDDWLSGRASHINHAEARDWMADRVARLIAMRADRDAATAAELRDDARERRDRNRVLRIVGNVWPDTEGDGFLRELRARTRSSGSTPFGRAPAPGELADGNDRPPPPTPPRPPQGARDGPVRRPSGDAWMRGFIDHLRMGVGPGGWSTSFSEPGTWSEA